MPSRSAPACPETPPPSIRAITSRSLSRSTSRSGAATTILWARVVKYSSSVRPLSWSAPVPGTRRTRAMASLRRPVAVCKLALLLGRALRGRLLRRVLLGRGGLSGRALSGRALGGRGLGCRGLGGRALGRGLGGGPLGRGLLCRRRRSRALGRGGLRSGGPGLVGSLGRGAGLREPAPGRELAGCERLRLLRLVAVIGAGVHAELARHLPAEPVVREHALDRLLDREGGLAGEQPGVDGLGQAARVAGVVVGDLLVLLAAGERDLLGVDHDHVVAGVGVGGEDRLVLAAQDSRGLRRKTTEDGPAGVQDVPTALDVTRLWRVGLHHMKDAGRSGRRPMLPAVSHHRQKI